MSSPLLIASFVISLLCPTPVFLYVLLLIFLSSLSATFFGEITHPILVGLRDAFVCFIARPPPPRQPALEDEEDGHAIIAIPEANQNGPPPN